MNLSPTYDTWLMNKYIGGGVRSFRLIALIGLTFIPMKERSHTHPHNYYLEILPDIGFLA